MITIGEIKHRVLDICRASLRDDEAAHSYEDALWKEVLQSIADGAENPDELAREALKSAAIDFNRWCA